MRERFFPEEGVEAVSRVSSPEIEALVNAAVGQNSKDQGCAGETLISRVERVVISENRVHIALKPREPEQGTSAEMIEIPWTQNKPDTSNVASAAPEGKPDQKLLQAVGRAHVWLNDLATGRHSSVVDLAQAIKCIRRSFVRDHGLRSWRPP
jgi:site-specific DNA recombinase